MSVGYGEIQLDRVSAKGGAAYISIPASTNATGDLNVPCREVWVQGAASNTVRVMVNLFATAAITAGVAIPTAFLSSLEGGVSHLNGAMVFPVSCLSAINCFATAVANVNVVWRR